VRAPGCGTVWRSEQAERGPGSRPAGDSTGGAATAQPRRVWAAQRGHVARSIEQGRGADRWATTTVPGGGTG
jgi:hypothetical protein